MNPLAFALLTIGALVALTFVLWPLGRKTPPSSRALADDELEALLAARLAERRQTISRCPRCGASILSSHRSCPYCEGLLSTQKQR